MNVWQSILGPIDSNGNIRKRFIWGDENSFISQYKINERVSKPKGQVVRTVSINEHSFHDSNIIRPKEEYENIKINRNGSDSRESTYRRSNAGSKTKLTSNNLSRVQTTMTMNQSQTNRSSKTNNSVRFKENGGVSSKKLKMLKNKTRKFDDESLKKFLEDFKAVHNQSNAENSLKSNQLDKRMLPHAVKYYKEKIQTRWLDTYDKHCREWQRLQRPATASSLINKNKYHNQKAQILKLASKIDHPEQGHYEKTGFFLRQYHRTTPQKMRFADTPSMSDSLRKITSSGFNYTDKSESNMKISAKQKVLKIIEFPISSNVDSSGNYSLTLKVPVTSKSDYITEPDFNSWTQNIKTLNFYEPESVYMTSNTRKNNSWQKRRENEESDQISKVLRNNKALQSKLQNMLVTNKTHKDLYVKGTSKFKSELEHCKSIPPDQRIYYVNHKLTDHGEGEPELSEEIIEADYPKLF